MTTPLSTVPARLTRLAIGPCLVGMALATAASAAPGVPSPPAPAGAGGVVPAPRAVGPGAGVRSGGAGGSGIASAAPAPQAAPLPPARPVDAILADIVAAVGGAAALAHHRALHTKMEITFKGLGISGTAEHFASVGDKALTVTEIPNLASTREGSDGTRFWSEDPINGLRLLDGAEAAQARIEVAWNAELRMKDLFHKIQASNERADDGSLLECLTLTPPVGAPMTDCFDGKTHLMSVQRGVRSSPQGDMPFTARLSDWRTVNDVKMAYATDMQVGPLSFTGRVTLVEMDTELPPGLFAVPTPNGKQAAAPASTAAPKKGHAPRVASGATPTAAPKRAVHTTSPHGGEGSPAAPAPNPDGPRP